MVKSFQVLFGVVAASSCCGGRRPSFALPAPVAVALEVAFVPVQFPASFRLVVLLGTRVEEL